MKAFCFAVLLSCFAHVLIASEVTVDPVDPKAGELVTISYDPDGGPLENSADIFIYRGFNGWAAVAGPDQEMEWDADSASYVFSYLVPEAAYQIDFVFRDGSDNWDNNGTLDWHVNVETLDTIPLEPGDLTLPETSAPSRVMMQGFYWDVPAGNWYNNMASKAAELRNMGSGQGIDRIWFPPPSKSESGPHSMGYDPFDYYDLGQYNQKGTVRTRFGTQDELKAAIAAFQDLGIVCMADIVLNHRSGGDWELNPNTGDSYWTDFSRVESGKMAWDYDDFHPSSLEVSDEGKFAGFPDVVHVADEGPGDPVYDFIEWGKWLQNSENAGFAGGWRFDYVKGYTPRMTRLFREGTGNPFGILECWDGIEMIDAYVNVSGGTSAFDFPGYYTMRDIFNSVSGSEDISKLMSPESVYGVLNPEYAVSFVANHDTDEISRNKMLAYAYILTSEAYPCLFWKDYFENGLADLGGQVGNGIKALVWVRGALAGGEPKIENLNGSNSDLLVYGSVVGKPTTPGFIVAINDHSSLEKSAEVKTSNPFLRGKTLKCYAWYSYASGNNVRPSDILCTDQGLVNVTAPPRGYAVYGPANLAVPSIMAEDFSGGNSKLRLTVRGLVEGKAYSIEASDDLGRNDGWESVGELTGPANGVGSIEIEWNADESVFWRVVSM